MDNKTEYIEKLERIVLERGNEIESLKTDNFNKDISIKELASNIAKDKSSKRIEYLEKIIKETEDVILSKVKGIHDMNKKIKRDKNLVQSIDHLRDDWKNIFQTFPERQKARLLKEAEELLYDSSHNIDEIKYIKVREFIVFNIYLPKILIKNGLLMDEDNYRQAKLCKFCAHRKSKANVYRCDITGRAVVEYGVCDKFDR